MKLSKLLLAGLLASTFASTAPAVTEVLITGSTAYRSQTEAAIRNIAWDSGTLVYGYNGTTFGKQNASFYSGTISSAAVHVKTSWSGSAAGVQVVSESLNALFIPDSKIGTLTSGGTQNIADPTAAGALPADKQAEIPTVAMSDVLQSTTPFTTPALNESVNSPVGVNPFVWVASAGSPASLGNMTPQLAQNLFPNGTVALALFSGLHADEGTVVFATGRDADSGTRLTAMSEPAVGVTIPLAQFKPTISAGAVTGYSLYPQSTINGVVYAAGNGGEHSGGSLATNMTGTTNATVGYSVTYLSTSDATTALTAATPGRLMTYCGVGLPFSGGAFTTPFTPILEGSYTFWCYEHMYFSSSIASDVKVVANSIAIQINSIAVIPTATMQVSRPNDGGNVTQNY